MSIKAIGVAIHDQEATLAWVPETGHASMLPNNVGHVLWPAPADSDGDLLSAWRSLLDQAAQIVGDELSIVVALSGWQVCREEFSAGSQEANLAAGPITQAPMVTAAALAMAETLNFGVGPRGEPAPALVLIADLSEHGYELAVVGVRPREARMLAWIVSPAPMQDSVNHGAERIDATNDTQSVVTDEVIAGGPTVVEDEPLDILTGESASPNPMIQPLGDAPPNVQSPADDNKEPVVEGESPDDVQSLENLNPVVVEDGQDPLSHASDSPTPPNDTPRPAAADDPLAALLQSAVAAAGIDVDHLDRLLLIGRHAMDPVWRNRFSELTGLIPDDRLHPLEAAARGAALLGYFRLMTPDDGADQAITVHESLPYDIAMLPANPSDDPATPTILFPRHCSLPAEVVLSLRSQSPLSEAASLTLRRGNSDTGVWHDWGRVVLPADSVPGQDDNPAELLIELTDVMSPPVVRWASREREFDRLARWEWNSAENQTSESVGVQVVDVVLGAAPAPWNAASLGETGAFVLGDVASPTEDTPATDYTGPQIVRRRPAKSASKSGLYMLVNLIGFVSFSVLGLAIGYYVLIWLRPEANFLRLPTPFGY